MGYAAGARTGQNGMAISAGGFDLHALSYHGNVGASREPDIFRDFDWAVYRLTKTKTIEVDGKKAQAQVPIENPRLSHLYEKDSTSLFADMIMRQGHSLSDPIVLYSGNRAARMVKIGGKCYAMSAGQFYKQAKCREQI